MHRITGRQTSGDCAMMDGLRCIMQEGATPRTSIVHPHPRIPDRTGSDLSHFSEMTSRGGGHFRNLGWSGRRGLISTSDRMGQEQGFINTIAPIMPCCLDRSAGSCFHQVWCVQTGLPPISGSTYLFLTSIFRRIIASTVTHTTADHV